MDKINYDKVMIKEIESFNGERKSILLHINEEQQKKNSLTKVSISVFLLFNVLVNNLIALPLNS